MHVKLNEQADNLHQNGKITVRSLYLALISNGVAHMNKRLKVHLKIKICMCI
jgi:hypothetical protein